MEMELRRNSVASIWSKESNIRKEQLLSVTKFPGVTTGRECALYGPKMYVTHRKDILERKNVKIVTASGRISVSRREKTYMLPEVSAEIY